MLPALFETFKFRETWRIPVEQGVNKTTVIL